MMAGIVSQQAMIKLDVETSYSSPISVGDRRSLITATAHGIGYGNGNSTKLVDGSTGGFVWWGAQHGDGYIQFDLGGTPRVIDALRWRQDNGASHGNWIFEGSQDASSWTQLGSNFTLTGSPGGVEFTFSNSTAYRYYRIHHLSGNISNSPYLYEIEFKAS